MSVFNATILLIKTRLYRYNLCLYLRPADSVLSIPQKIALDLVGFALLLYQMHLSVCKLLLFLHRSALLAIYAAFFLVQFFCVTGQNNTTVPAATPSYHADQGKQKIVAAKSDRTKKTKVRLNKRFQPAIADDILNPIAELPVKYINTDNPAKPREYLLISFILAASLRGPPSLS
jgi:hypothetical protein